MKRFISLFIGCMLVHVLFQSSSFANEPSISELTRFTEEFFQDKMERGDIPGGVISIVQEGGILFSFGFGYADLKNAIANDPRNTHFRVGSIGKAFTATAAMQLIEEHGLDPKEVRVWDDLHLKPIEESKAAQIRLHHLLTHTAGYDETMLNFYTLKAEEVSFTRYIENHTPPLKRAPGEEIEYSNFGMTLLGQWVEDVSGQSFHTYIEDHIFEPLEMSQSTFIQNEHMEGLAKSYYRGQSFPYGYLHMEPAGTLTSTAEDMARFMIGHLERNENLGSAKLFNAMHTTQHRMHEEMPGMTYGFYEGELNGRKTLRHEGSVDVFVSEMVLLPQERTGIFVSVNGATGNETSGVIREYMEGVMELLFLDKPRAETMALSPLTNATELRVIEGTYTFNRSVENGPLRLLKLFSNLPTINVRVVTGGMIEVDEFFNQGETNRFVETKIPFHFERENTSERIVFLQDGKQITFVSSRLPQVVLKQIGWSDGRWFTMIGAGLIGVVSIGYIIMLPIIGTYRYWKKKRDGFRNERILLFFLALSLLLSMIALFTAVQLFVYGYLMLGSLLLFSPVIPFILSLALILTRRKVQTIIQSSPSLKYSSYLLHGCIALFLFLWVWWDLTPFHL